MSADISQRHAANFPNKRQRIRHGERHTGYAHRQVLREYHDTHVEFFIQYSLFQCAGRIREEAHVRAPRSAHGHPATQGRTAKHLADQLTTSVSASKYTAGVTVVGGVNGPSYYWKYLEYGTKRIKERAFIRESAEARGDEAMETVKREIEARLGIK
ncbi:MAG: HK97 gp10 family phage protein [Clostridia bacterium]|nr:HK97 gp10 family phage protein [Clostridia bacterium]